MAMGPPADERSEIGQHRVVEQKNVQKLQGRPQEQDQQGNDDQLSSVVLPNAVRRSAKQIHHPAHVVDQPDFYRGDHHGHQASQDEDTFEGLRIVAQEWPQPGRRRVLFRIVAIRINEVFEETKHSGCSDYLSKFRMQFMRQMGAVRPLTNGWYRR